MGLQAFKTSVSLFVNQKQNSFVTGCCNDVKQRASYRSTLKYQSTLKGQKHLFWPIFITNHRKLTDSCACKGERDGLDVYVTCCSLFTTRKYSGKREGS